MALVKASPRVVSQFADVAPVHNSVVPRYIQEAESGVFDILDAYYKWMDLDGGIHKDAKMLPTYMNKDTTNDEFIYHIKSMFMSSFPDVSESKIQHILNFAKTFYGNRGTPDSYKFLFRALYKEDVDISYPSASVFRSSDAKWETKEILKCVFAGQDVNELIERRVYGVTSDASAIVKSITTYIVNNAIITEMTVDNVRGTFGVDEIIETRDERLQVRCRTLGQIVGYTINNPGYGYIENSIIKTNGGDGTPITVKIATTDDLGRIIKLDILESGVNYVGISPILDLGDSVIFTPESILDDSYVEADIQLNIGAVYKTPGEYIEIKSAPSSGSSLMDGYYYQQYSYVLSTNVPVEEFRPAVTALLHPVGTIMFSKPSIITNASKALNNTGSLLFQYSKPAEIMYNNVDTSSTRKYNDMFIWMFNDEFKFNPEFAAAGVSLETNRYEKTNVMSLETRNDSIIISNTYKTDLPKIHTDRLIYVRLSGSANFNAIGQEGVGEVEPQYEDLFGLNPHWFNSSTRIENVTVNSMTTAHIEKSDSKICVDNKITRPAMSAYTSREVYRINEGSTYLYDINQQQLNTIKLNLESYGLNPRVAASQVITSP